MQFCILHSTFCIFRKEAFPIMANPIKSGGISVETQNIFPVIKKWLYSDKDIFVRELVSNACDAITKHKRLVSLGEATGDDAPYRIDVVLDNDLGTLTFSDNGIGMNAEEIDKYINQIALSGAVDFIEKYETVDGAENKDGGKGGIIGHFGLGFYSAFMIADKVEIRSKSWHDDASVLWKGTDEGDFEMSEDDERTTRGTDIILYINDDEKSYASGFKIREILDKFCAFMPVEIYFTELPEKQDQTDNNKEEKIEPKPINDTTPLWLKRPQDCTEEEYKAFYTKVFHDYREPLFWVHINADYPLNFKGILFFPKMENEFSNYEGQVKLYYNQVFVADNIKEVIPEYLLLLKGVIDCPELPLNVSRSYLQTNGYVEKISAHIVKKVCDKISSLYNTEREKYEGMWNDVKLFVEYGCVRDKKFFDRVKDCVLYKTTAGKYVTLAEYAEGFPENATPNKKVYYTDDKKQQAAYISMFDKENVPIVELDKLLDIQFVSAVEHTDYGEALKDIKFVRVDSGVGDLLKEEKNDADQVDAEKLTKFVEETLSGGEHLKVSAEYLKDASVPAVLNLSEESRRFSDMMKMYGSMMNSPMPLDMTLVLNLSSPLTAKLLDKAEGDISSDDTAQKLVKQIYLLAVLAQRPLEAEELSEFIELNSTLLTNL